jgi:16S rRNA (guanine527-N7)-methyltransferase
LHQLEKYKELLLKWNKTHHLVSKSQARNLDEHIEDSLSVSDLLGPEVLDLGSGGGFPGIPLAIKNPTKKFYLVESNAKKSAFLLNTSNQLELKNVEVYNKRIEELLPEGFPNNLEIITRAFGSAAQTIKSSEHFLSCVNNSLKLMKTAQQHKEEELPEGYKEIKQEKILLKGKDKGRILVTIESTKN